MDKLQVRSDKVYTYVSNAFIVASNIPGLGVLQYAAQGVDLLYKNLEWNGVFESSATTEQKEQLKTILSNVVRSVCEGLPKNKRNILIKAHSMVEHILLNSEMDTNTINQSIESALQNPTVNEGEWLTPNDRDGLCALFLAKFYDEIKGQPTLATAVCVESIRSLTDEIIKAHKRIDIIDYDIAEITRRLEKLEHAGSIIDIALPYLSYTLYGKVNRPRVITHSPRIYTEHYIQRNEEDLRGHIRNGEKILLSSMGGIGKTHLCSYMFRQYVNNPAWSKEIDCIGFLEIGDNEDNAVYNGIIFDKTGNREADLNNMWNILERTANEHKFDLFIDDIRSDSGNTKKLTLDRLSRLQCPIILASRETRIKGFKKVDLDFLSDGQALALFKSVYGTFISSEDEQSILTHIVMNRVGRHTLALELVANTARGFGWSLSDLEHNLDKKEFQIEQGDSDDSIQQEFQKLYQMANLTEPEKNILEAFSMFPYKALDLDVCVSWLYEDAELDKDHCRKRIVSLADRSWLQESKDQERGRSQFAMHMTVASAVKGQGMCEYERHKGLVERCTDDLFIDDMEVFTKALPYIPFAESLALRNDSIETEEMGRLNHQIGYIYSDQGNYTEALKYYKKALAICEKVLGSEHPNTATTYNNIALVYHDQGNYTEALKYYKKALVIYEKVLGSKHPDTATTYNNIALVYHDQGNYTEALKYYEKALIIRKKVLGSEHPSTATTYNNIAGVYKDQGNYTEALKYYKKALAICEKVLGSEHPSTATTYNNIALVYQYQGNYTEALKYYEKALIIREKVLGSKHPSTATTYNNIAGVYKAQGNYTEALKYYKKALAICEKVLGKEHPNTATTYNNIALVYQDQGNYTEALKYYKKALAICEKVLGKEHPSTATTYNNIATVCKEQGNYSEALEYCEKALGILKMKLGDKHPNTIIAGENLQILKEEMGID